MAETVQQSRPFDPQDPPRFGEWVCYAVGDSTGTAASDASAVGVASQAGSAGEPAPSARALPRRKRGGLVAATTALCILIAAGGVARVRWLRHHTAPIALTASRDRGFRRWYEQIHRPRAGSGTPAVKPAAAGRAAARPVTASADTPAPIGGQLARSQPGQALERPGTPTHVAPPVPSVTAAAPGARPTRTEARGADPTAPAGQR